MTNIIILGHGGIGRTVTSQIHHEIVVKETEDKTTIEKLKEELTSLPIVNYHQDYVGEYKTGREKRRERRKQQRK